jgi:hypothetical protein
MQTASVVLSATQEFCRLEILAEITKKRSGEAPGRDPLVRKAARKNPGVLAPRPRSAPVLPPAAPGGRFACRLSPISAASPVLGRRCARLAILLRL